MVIQPIALERQKISGGIPGPGYLFQTANLACRVNWYAVPRTYPLDGNDSLTHTALGIAHLFRSEYKNNPGQTTFFEIYMFSLGKKQPC